MNKIKVTINGKEMERKVYTDKAGDRFIQHHNEKWLLKRHENEVLHPVTNNLTSAMWEKHNYIDSRMHHMDKIKPFEHATVISSLRTLTDWYKKEEKFLDAHYEVDSHALNEWIDYAHETLKKDRY